MFNCPECSAGGRVISLDKHDTYIRRYHRCPNHHHFSTVQRAAEKGKHAITKHDLVPNDTLLQNIQAIFTPEPTP